MVHLIVGFVGGWLAFVAMSGMTFGPAEMAVGLLLAAYLFSVSLLFMK